MTTEQILAELGSDSLINRVRRELSFSAGRIEQAGSQRRRISPVELRRMEFEAAAKIIAMVRATPEPGGASDG